MKWFSWLWIDDSTGKFSDTTLRTWLMFFLFLICVIYLVFIDSQILPEELSVLNLISLSALGQGGLYLGKRMNERKERVDISEFRITQKGVE